MDLGINISMIFSHILPSILGFLGIILMINGVMDKHKNITIAGIVVFLVGVLIPFIALPILLN